VDCCTSASTMFSFAMSVYVVCASTKCCSIALFSSDSSMNIGFIDVAPDPIYFLTHQCLLLLCKNSTTNVLVVSMS
jgi:hypothetical protein